MNNNQNNENLIDAMFKSISVQNEHKEENMEGKVGTKIDEKMEDKVKIEEKVDTKIDEKIKIAKIPIVLVDNSGSTASMYSNTGQNILKNEVDIIKKILLEKKYEKCYIMYWNTSEIHSKESIEVATLDKSLKNLGVNATGGTDISVAIHNIPDLWFQGVTDIYIVTDGEVNEDKYKFKDQIFSLTKRKINLNIVTVENNSHNYFNANVQAGSNIYSIIQNNKLSKYIRRFECYNKFHHTEPFVNFYNPEIKKGQFSFKEYIFKEEDFNKFTEIILEIINLYRDNKDYLEKIIYHLSFTIYQYTKSKSQKIKNEVVRLFTALFEEAYNDTDYIKNIFESEMKNHEEGSSKTFQQYRENRKKLFEKTQDELYANVSECFASGNQFTSFVINTTNPDNNRIIVANSMNSPIRLSDLYFNNGGIKYGDYNVPMFSIYTKNNENSEQAMRQWIRAIYSRIHNIQINDEKILYLFLTDMMSIVLSDLPDNIKNGYKNCARILLNANRFNSGGIKQITWLTMGNKPKPMIPGYSSMDEILNYCKKYYSSTLQISPEEFWYAICSCYNFKELSDKQIPANFKIDELLEQLKQVNKKYQSEQIDIIDELDYYDYITLEDTSLTGGYKLPEYKIGKKTFKIKFVISQESYNFLKSQSIDNKTKCPITGRLLDLNAFVKVSPANNDINYVVDHANFNMNIFNRKKYEKIDINKLDKMELQNLELKRANEYDWTNYPYEFTPKVPMITEKLYKERIQYKSTEEFKNQITIRYEWLNKLCMKNLAIAGGFCKSLIFDEKVNDIDLYMYGLNDDNEYSERLGKLVDDLTKIISEKYEKVVALQAYKKEFNVYELIYFENIKDLQKQNFELQDLTQMKYITKIQIIMKKHNEMKEIFNYFDLDSSCVIWNGTELYFNDRSYIAYKYLINIPRIDKFYTDIYDLRLLKYYNSGFRIILPRMTEEQIEKKLSDENTFVIGKSKFYVSGIENSNVYIDKTELIMVKEEKVKSLTNSVSIYNSIIGDLGSLNDSRSIVKFMKYVQRQNRLVERVKKNQENNVEMNDTELLDTINDEMKEDLEKLKFKNKKYVKSDAYISDSDNDNNDTTDDDSDNSEDDEDTDDTTDINNTNKNKIDNNTDKNKIDNKSINNTILNNSTDILMNLKKDDLVKDDLAKDDLATDDLVKDDLVKDDIVKDDIVKDDIVKDDIFENLGLNDELKTNTMARNNIIILDNQVKKMDEIEEIIPEDITLEETKKPEDYIKVYYKVCGTNDTRKLNEFDNGTCQLKFIWQYDGYHGPFDWYNDNAEVRNKEIEEKIKKEKEEFEKTKLQDNKP